MQSISECADVSDSSEFFCYLENMNTASHFKEKKTYFTDNSN